MNFEDGITELENIIKQLEQGDVKFDYAEKLFERGAELCKILNKSLEETKGRVSIIREELGSLLEEDMK